MFGYSENTDLLSLGFWKKEKAKGDDEDAERRRVKDALRSAEIGAKAVGRDRFGLHLQVPSRSPLRCLLLPRPPSTGNVFPIPLSRSLYIF